jgi:3-oxoacyl-(acyl-carrier-protein) synthase
MSRPAVVVTCRRVVITGMGMITALGNDVPTTWAGLRAGRSGIRRIEAFDPSRINSQMAEVRDFDPSAVLDRKDIRRTDRYIQFGLVVAREALDQAGFPGRMEGELAERTGVILAGLGGVGTRSRGSRRTPCAARTGSARSWCRWASPTSVPARWRSRLA